jgi:hypothetical protein
LLDKPVVVLFMVAAAGEREAFCSTPRFGGVVDELRAVIAVRLFYGEKGGCFQV